MLKKKPEKPQRQKKNTPTNVESPPTLPKKERKKKEKRIKEKRQDIRVNKQCTKIENNKTFTLKIIEIKE